MGDRPGVYENGIFRKGDVRISDLSGRKRLPIGDSNFTSVVEESVFVDKSMLIADVLGGGSMVTLFCRPRRFGKSLNLSMLQRFLEAAPPGAPSDDNTRFLFEGLAIWEAQGGAYCVHHGAYPVVRLSFNNAKRDTWAETRGMIEQRIRAEFERHRYLLESEIASPEEREQFQRILAGRASDGELSSSLLSLTVLLQRFYGKRVVILIDEYDAPVMAGYTEGYYRESIGFLKGWAYGSSEGQRCIGVWGSHGRSAHLEGVCVFRPEQSDR